MIQLQLQELGFNTDFLSCEVRLRLWLFMLVGGPSVSFHFSRLFAQVESGGEETWNGVAFRYFDGNSYFIPVVKWAEGSAEGKEEEEGGAGVEGGGGQKGKGGVCYNCLCLSDG